MGRLYLDFESYWADDFTLKKITPIEYVMDPRFEALGCGFAFGDEDPFWIDGPELPKFFKLVDWQNTFAVSHNALFDMLILSHRYGVVPGAYGDTLSMARNWLAHKLPSCGLKSVAEYYGMDPKWETVSKTKGLCLAAIRELPSLYQELRGYAVDDTLKCRTIFARMIDEGFPWGELETIDMVVRMATLPRFELDTMVLAEHLNAVKAKKEALLEACYMEATDLKSLMSDQQLAMKLLFLNVDIPMKLSKATGKKAYAFAKTDKAFTALLDDDNPMVQALVAARLGHKSTLEETRTQRLLSIASCVDKMPVPLKYSGAHTHRLSGDWSINLQNLPRGGELRKAFKAPEGKVVVAVDASQIEARFNAELSGEYRQLTAFREGRDVYSEFAENIYGYSNFSKQSKERFVGKTAILSLGYGSSWPVFQNMCRLQGDVHLSDADAVRIVNLYRTMYPQIVQNWRHANSYILPRLAQRTSAVKEGEKEEPVAAWGPVQVYRHRLELPNGNCLRYNDLHIEYGEDRQEYRYLRGNTSQKIYGAKLVENVIQALAFVAIMDAAKRVKKLSNAALMPVHQVHDELIYIVNQEDADWVAQMVMQEMSRPPQWMPDVPLAAEAHIGKTYYDAK